MVLGLAAIAAQTLPPSAALATAPVQQSERPARVAPAPPVDAFVEPSGATVELFASLSDGNELKQLLERTGADAKDSARASELVDDAVPAGIPEGTEVAVLLGQKTGSARRLERVSFKPSLAFKVTIGRIRTGDFKLARDGVNVDTRPRRFKGAAGSDLFWSLRASGVPAEAANEFLEAMSSRINVRQVAPDDRFDLVIDHVRAETGENRGGPLLYAALDRRNANDLTFVRWTVGGHTGLFDPTMPAQRTDGFARPVQAKVSSSFGHRLHPILRFARFHQGVDFGARWGTPVAAAADGIVRGADWAGGYGRQVRLVHSSGVLTSYSHLSSFAVAPGTYVRRGQVIGYVGSSGLSTGPHLHFEVRKDGQPVDPLSFSFARAPLGSAELAVLRARAEQLRGV
ncbi:MAG: M23 family metallopeptidase [Sphingomonas sp.]|nr:M23 family metallopeptidase [Sphingomonas sp.]